MFFYYLAAILSILLYLHGFFPIPPRPSNISPPNKVTAPKPIYDKGVIIIIDALRLDFVSPTTTPFVSKKLQDTGCFIQLKVETPTVTLPRIKALTTGNVAQFVDIILNLANPTKVDDSFIHRAVEKGKKVIFYGDDLWIKLFGDQFVRSEGTSSFFVNDFYEVDGNVTRNVEIEKNNHDWDIMILHYLGLDHIGHVYGPKSSLISKKLEEMDKVIRSIYESVKNDTFVMITGDHGMRDSGGHGGSTFSETNVPLIVLNMPCKNDTFEQIDIPTNLALLFGFDIPATSIGQLQDSLIHYFNDEIYLQALRHNLEFLQNKKNLCTDDIVKADYFFDLYKLNKTNELKANITEIYKSCIKEINKDLLKHSVEQNVTALVVAGLLVFIILLKIFSYMIFNTELDYQYFILFIILGCQFFYFNFYINTIVSIFIAIIFIKTLRNFNLKWFHMKEVSFLMSLSVIHPITFCASSFLEEEQEFWYYFTSTFFLLIFSTKNLKQWLTIFGLIRFVRTINQVGDKWASLPDLSDWLVKEENFIFLQALFATALIFSFFTNKFVESIYSKAWDGIILLLIFFFKMSETVGFGQILWLLIFIRFLLSLKNKESFVSIWILVCTLLFKPYNTILIPTCIFCSQFFHKVLTGNNLVIAHWWLGNLLFFAQGHDNSLASVDIAAGYIGLKEYEPIFVFSQVLCHTYALPVLSHLLLFTNKNVSIFKSFSIFIFFRLYIVFIVFIVTFIQRHHLFIFSVFAPKMFVEASHFGFLFIEISCYYLIDLIKKI